MTTYVIAADGGNSKTDLVLSTVDGEVLAQVQGGGTHPHVTGMDRTAEDLAAMVAQVRERAGLPASAKIGVGAFYLANVDVAADEREARAALERLARRRAAGGVQRRVRRAARRKRPRMGSRGHRRRGRQRGRGAPERSGGALSCRSATSPATGGGGHGGGRGRSSARRCGPRDGRGLDTKLTIRVAEHYYFPGQRRGGGAGDPPSRDPLRGSANSRAGGVQDGLRGAIRSPARSSCGLGDEVANMAATLLRRLRLLDSDADVVLGGGTLQSGNRILIERIGRV